jgi:hypothetical protein
MKCGALHLSVSSTSGHAEWTISRRWVRIGRANSGDRAM